MKATVPPVVVWVTALLLLLSAVYYDKIEHKIEPPIDDWVYLCLLGVIFAESRFGVLIIEYVKIQMSKFTGKD